MSSALRVNQAKMCEIVGEWASLFAQNLGDVKEVKAVSDYGSAPYTFEIIFEEKETP